MIAVNQLFLAFGDRVLFDNMSLFIGEKDKVGLVGKNGAGKSTLMRLLNGEQATFKGSIGKPTQLSVGYLAQEISFQSKQTIRNACKSVFSDVLVLEKRKTEIEQLLSDETQLENPNYGNWLDELTELNEKLAVATSDKIDKQVELILAGLGFDKGEYDHAVNTLSGGWQMRVELARLLLAQPQLLLLDEPTNHLDIIAIDWLQEFLSNYPGAVILISHDQYFLDQVTERTIELSGGKSFDYKFSYSKYLSERQANIEMLRQKKKEQEKYVKETKVLIEKFRAKKNKAAFAQGLIKKLDRMEEIRIDDFDHSAIRFFFQEPQRSGKVVVKTDQLNFSYDTKPLFKDLDLELVRGEKVALLGKNGTGKTTLIKIIAGLISTNSGVCELGHNVELGYYAQDQSGVLDMEKTVLETIEAEATGDLFTASRKILGTFLFSGEDVDKKVKVLSGGEKARLSLCRLLLKPYNLLILDEPTNHLDIPSKRILKNALKKYTGTVLVVSHDREFLSGLTDRIVEIKTDGIKEYLSDIDAFLSEKKKESIASFERVNSTATNQQKKSNSKQKSDYLKRKELEKSRRKLTSEIERCENQMEKLELDMHHLEDQMGATDFYEQPKHQNILDQHQKVLHQLWKVEQKWEKAMLDIEALEGAD